MMKSSLFKGIAGPDNALRGPKCISLLGPDLSLHTGHWVLTSFRTKLVSTSSEGPGSIMVPSIQWALHRHTLISSLSVWGWPCLSHPKLVAALCRGLKRLSQGIMGHYLVQVSKECRAKKICPWPNRAWEEFFFFYFWIKYILWLTGLPMTSYFHKVYKNRRLLGMSRHCLMWATQEKTFGSC